MPYLTSKWGNPSGAYKFGPKLKPMIETARAQVVELIRAQAREIIFTSCGIESNNTAIHAALRANPSKKHIITSADEYSSVLNHCIALEKDGYRVTYLSVDRDGLLRPADLENAISDDTAVVSLMWANNETGVLFPIKEISETLPVTRCAFPQRRSTGGREDRDRCREYTGRLPVDDRA